MKAIQNEEPVDLVQQTINKNMKDVILAKNPVFKDERGLFFPLPLDGGWVQSNISLSKKWTFRGLHHQIGKHAQTKKITVLSGSIIDFIVDIRMGNFMEAKFFRLVPGETIIVPAGCAHGFLAMEDNTMIQYLVDREYSPSNEVSFDWKSVELVNEIISAEVGDGDFLSISPKDKVGRTLTKDFIETKETLQR